MLNQGALWKQSFDFTASYVAGVTVAIAGPTKLPFRLFYNLKNLNLI